MIDYMRRATSAKDLSSDLLQIVSTAAKPSDIPVAERNKLYMRMTRLMESAAAGRRPDIDPRVVARFAAEKGDRAKKLSFLQEWIQDPTSCSRILYMETVTEAKEQVDTNLYEWKTEFDLNREYNTPPTQAGAEYVHKLIAGAKKPKPHPQHPKDKTMLLYRVFSKLSEASSNTKKRSRELSGSAVVADAEAAASLTKSFGALAAPVRDDDDADGENKPKKAKAKAAGTAKAKAKGKSKAKSKKLQDDFSSLAQSEHIRIISLGMQMRHLAGSLKIASQHRIDICAVEEMDKLVEQLATVASLLETAFMAKETDVVVEAIITNHVKLFAAITDEEEFIRNRMSRLSNV
jgi:hypothetical protein